MNLRDINGLLRMLDPSPQYRVEWVRASMRRTRHFTTFAFAILVVCPPRGQATDFTIDAWSLETGIIEDQNYFVGSYSPEPLPYSDTQLVSIGLSTSFLIEGSHVASDANRTRSLSAGNIFITPAVDLLLSATGRYDWDLTTDAMAVTYALLVDDPMTQEYFFAQGDSHTTFLDGPAAGTYLIDGQAVLPAGREIRISYFFILDAFEGNSGLLATGEGFIQWTLAPVPEPATLALLA
ncbi:MAG: hypothetical protein DCC63_18790, partial [Nitrospira sp.]